MYKPTAWVTTLMCFVGWQLLTGRAPTRITKRVEGRKGVQETGEFAEFLAEVFGILGIKASAAGQDSRCSGDEAGRWMHDLGP